MNPWHVEGKRPTDSPVTVFGHFIRMHRQNLGLTQKDIALKLGYGDAVGFNSVECGRCCMPATRLDALGEALGLTRAQLLPAYNLDIHLRKRQVDRVAMR